MNTSPSADWPPDILEPVVEALADGADEQEEARVLAVAASSKPGETGSAAADAVRQAALRALVTEPWLCQTLTALEEWLDGVQDMEVAIPLATGWALPGAGLDLAVASEEARLYIEAYPFEGRIVGDLDRRTARWLAERLILVQAAPEQRLPAVRRAIITLSEAAMSEFPQAAASIRAIADQLADGRLWYELALRITQRQLAPTS
jgi:hypothetical protein